MKVDFCQPCGVSLSCTIDEGVGRSVIAGGRRYIVVQPRSPLCRVVTNITTNISGAWHRWGTDASSHEYCLCSRAPDLHRRGTARKHSHATAVQDEWSPIEHEARGPGRPCHDLAVLNDVSSAGRACAKRSAPGPQIPTRLGSLKAIGHFGRAPVSPWVSLERQLKTSRTVFGASRTMFGVVAAAQ